MPSRYAALAASLAASNRAALPNKKLDSRFRGNDKKKNRLSIADIEAMLLRFLNGDEEGSASRLAVAKLAGVPRVGELDQDSITSGLGSSGGYYPSMAQVASQWTTALQNAQRIM
jgi:hypothetical protein